MTPATWDPNYYQADLIKRIERAASAMDLETFIRAFALSSVTNVAGAGQVRTCSIDELKLLLIREGLDQGCGEGLLELVHFFLLEPPKP